jgi:hypothetical protein
MGLVKLEHGFPRSKKAKAFLPEAHPQKCYLMIITKGAFECPQKREGSGQWAVHRKGGAGTQLR